MARRSVLSTWPPRRRRSSSARPSATWPRPFRSRSHGAGVRGCEGRRANSAPDMAAAYQLAGYERPPDVLAMQRRPGYPRSVYRVWDVVGNQDKEIVNTTVPLELASAWEMIACARRMVRHVTWFQDTWRSPHTEHLRLDSHRHHRKAHDMRGDPGNQPEAPSRSRAAPPRRLVRRCAVVLGCAAAAALLVGCSKARPATSATADASAASASEKRDAALTEAIRTSMQRASIPGAIVGVWREGQPPYVRALGVRDTASGQPMATDLYMRIGSNTKAFVVTGILMLADQGKLGLDDPIDRYVKGVPSGDRITLRQLAQMRSGLYDYADDINKDLPQQPFRQWKPHELLEIAFRHTLVFPPGSAFDYCNTNTVLLGLVVEQVSGQSLASFIEQNILKPEGMTHTVFPARAEIPSPHAHGYFKMPDGKIVDATDWNPSWGWASGNMISTLDDMRVWAHNLAIGKLISSAMKQEQQQFLPAPPEGDGALYGLALENQNGWIGHNGNTMSYMVYPYYLPSEGMTMVVMLNSGADIPGSWMMIQDITRIISPNNVWPGLPKEAN